MCTYILGAVVNHQSFECAILIRIFFWLSSTQQLPDRKGIVPLILNGTAERNFFRMVRYDGCLARSNESWQWLPEHNSIKLVCVLRETAE
jgi:hypothetical protein